MPKLQCLFFEFQFYSGTPNKDPVGINHLRSLVRIYFECNEDWYGGENTCISPTIDVMWNEAQGHPSLYVFEVCGRQEKINSTGGGGVFSRFIHLALMKYNGARLLYKQTSMFCTNLLSPRAMATWMLLLSLHYWCSLLNPKLPCFLNMFRECMRADLPVSCTTTVFVY